MEIYRPTSSEYHSTPSLEPKKENPAPPAPRLDLEDLYCILQVDPNDSLIALELSRRLRALGRLDESVKILRSTLKIDYRFETVHALAQAEYQLKLIDEAFVHLQEALTIAPEISPEFFELFKTLGNIFVRRKNKN